MNHSLPWNHASITLFSVLLFLWSSCNQLFKQAIYPLFLLPSYFTLGAPKASSLCQSLPLYGREKKTDLLFLLPLHVIFQLYLGPGLYHTWEVALPHAAEDAGIGRPDVAMRPDCSRSVCAMSQEAMIMIAGLATVLRWIFSCIHLVVQRFSCFLISRQSKESCQAAQRSIVLCLQMFDAWLKS